MPLCEVNGMEETAELTTDSDASVLSKISSNYSKVSDAGNWTHSVTVHDIYHLHVSDINLVSMCYFPSPGSGPYMIT